MRRQLANTPQAAGLQHLSGSAESLHPVLARIYAGRDVVSSSELDYSLARLLPTAGLAGLEDAVALLMQALQSEWKILVVADVDADGATSCALALRALRLMGARPATYLVPNRFQYGYGLTPEIVAVAQESCPDLIVTVDNGISSLDGVRVARARGIRVLITDHHLPGAELPAADAIINPNCPGDTFASKHLAGVGVIFYVMAALRARLREIGWFADRQFSEPNLAQLLDLVALGTVADVARLDYNNRILVAQGLARIRSGQCCAGIRALIQVASRQRSRLIAADLGFALGPRLNAAGRLEDMSLGIECLLTDDEGCALEMAHRLDALNQERRRIEQQMKQEAIQHLEGLELLQDDGQLPSGLCLFHDDWHQGVVGILAARIKERWHRPVIAFARTGENELKGSARSVSGLHIRDVLDAIATQHPGLILKFGGHAMAAGLSLKEENYPRFSQIFGEEVGHHLDTATLQGVITSDGELRPDDMTLEMAQVLRAGGPWGQGFPEPIFDGRFQIRAQRQVGEHHLKLQLSPLGSSFAIDAIAFNTAEIDDHQGQAIQIAYRLEVNEFRGACQAQLVVEQVIRCAVERCDLPSASNEFTPGGPV